MPPLWSGAFEISGRGRGLFEGNVVVQTLDSAGRPLTLEPVTMSTDEIGGEGEWSAVVELDYVGRGQIVVYSPSPDDGSWMASASVDVVFGDVDTLPSHLLITYPLPNAIVSNETNIYAVAGYVSPAAVDNVFVLVVDEFGDIHYSAPAEVDRATGLWSLVAEPDVVIETDQKLTLHVVAVSPVDGNILARDRFRLTARPASATVTGHVAYLERIALPEDAIVKMRLVNASLADAPPEMTTEGEQTIFNPGQAPIPFALRYNPANINENMLYSVSARIEDSAGNLLFISTTSNPVITQGNPSEDVEVLVSAP